MATFYSPRMITEGLVFFVDAANTRSYPGSGTTWFDISGNGNSVTLTNGPTWNSAGYFSNDADSYFTGAGSASIPTGNSPYCMGVWARQPSSWAGTSGAGGFISIGGYNSTNQSNALRTLNTGTGHFHHYWWANDLSLSNNNAGLALNTWFFVLAQFDGTTRSIWVNGTQYASDTPTSHNVASTTIQVSKTVGTEYQQGDVAVAFIYNRALTSAEVSQNFNALRTRFGI